MLRILPKKVGHIYLLDQIRDKWEAPDLRTNIIQFCKKHQEKTNGYFQALYVEDASSGSSLIQDINRGNYGIIVEGITRGGTGNNKVFRANDGAPYIYDGQVHLPKKAIFLNDYITEFNRFNREMSHKHDDQVDATLDAIDLTLPTTIPNIPVAI